MTLRDLYRSADAALRTALEAQTAAVNAATEAFRHLSVVHAISPEACDRAFDAFLDATGVSVAAQERSAAALCEFRMAVSAVLDSAPVSAARTILH